MKVLCFLIPFFLYIIDSIYPHHLNVGTVLFTKADLSRKCWSEQEKSLITARQMMQGILPDPDFMDITRPGTLTVLVEYFQTCIEEISQSTSGKTQQLMYLALFDALGGYLRSYVLPVTRQAYYAGHVKYCEVIKIYQFYNDVKDFLKTDGCGWAAPKKFNFCCKIRPLKITTKDCETACAQLYFKENSKQNSVFCDAKESPTQQAPNCSTIPLPMTTQETPFTSISLLKKCLDGNDVINEKLTDLIAGYKSQKLNDRNRYDNVESWLTRTNEIAGQNVEKIEKMRENARILKDRLQWSTVCPSYYEQPEIRSDNNSLIDLLRLLKSVHKREGCPTKKASCSRELSIPLPVLDDPDNPHAIGIPFRKRPIRTLDSPHSICILVRYYITVIKCLVTKCNSKCDLFNFNAQFQAWLTSYVGNVFPRLTDETWYPAFGGVLRIAETINSIRPDSSFKCLTNCENDLGFMFSTGVTFDESDYLKNNDGSDEGRASCQSPDERTYLTLAIVAIVLMWIMAFCYCIFCYCPTARLEDKGLSDTKKENENKNSFIVQCLVKFFKRAAVEEGKIYCPNLTQGEKDEGDETNSIEMEIVNRRLSPINTPRTVSNESPGRLDKRDNKRYSRQRETIVLPAQISPIHTDLPLGLTSFWPFSDFQDDAGKVRQYPKGCSKGPSHHFERKEWQSRSPNRKSEQCKTVWRRKRSVRSLDSYDDLPPRKAFAVCGNEKSKYEERGKIKEKTSSNCTDDSRSENENRKRLIYVRRSRPGFCYPGSFSYSYDSASNSYSTSQVDDDARMDLYDRFVACRNSFPKKSRLKHRQARGSRSDSESERDMSTSNSSGSVLTPKRKP